MMTDIHSQSIDTQQQRIALLLEYFGPAFSGAARQIEAYTVQGALENTLAKLNIPHTGVCLAGRTDAGVHAKGQVVHFDIPFQGLNQIPSLNLSLNAKLPHTMSVKDSVIVPLSEVKKQNFHATVSAQWRWYQYRIFNQPLRSTWKRPDAAWVRYPMDVERMAEGARYFLGEHDFESFKCPRTDNMNNVCNVIHSRLYREDENYIVFDIVANRFVYKMVRNLMGLLIQIGLDDRLQPEDIPQIIGCKARQDSFSTAQPEGLSLMAVHYPKPWDFFQNDVYVTTLNQIIQESSSYEKNVLRKAS